MEPITQQERVYLRELAKRQQELAALPVMQEREALWYAHNDAVSERPVIVMESDTFIGELIPSLTCESELARTMEWQLLYNIRNYEYIDDDKVVPDYYGVELAIAHDNFGITLDVERPDMAGDTPNIGFHINYAIEDLERDFSKLRPSIFTFDKAKTEAMLAAAEETLGDILPVRTVNNSLRWHFGITQRVVELMGLENMMFAMYDYPDQFHALMRFITDDMLRFASWQEENGLLLLNNGNDFTGAGSFGFTSRLPKEDFAGKVRTCDQWLNINSQESSSISPDMYHAFVLPYYKELAERYGLVYYGCCEPVHDVWEGGVETIPNLKKVSISAWCNEEVMGERLSGHSVIYSRKPSPNFVGAADVFDEEAYGEHIAHTLRCAKGCNVEFILRDIYSLKGELDRANRVVGVIKRQIEKLW